MSSIYGLDDIQKRKLNFLYRHSGIEKRYSVIDDFSQPRDDWSFIPRDENDTFPCIEDRMKIFQQEAPVLAIQAIHDCIEGYIAPGDITHLITVSCTGMSAPGLDLQVAEAMQLRTDIFRTSVNFMGCYAAVHALKLAKLICDSTPNANIVIAAAELCTIHFQNDYTPDNAASSLLFSDGCAAVLVSDNIQSKNALSLKGFYSQVAYKGKNDMAWELSSKGFLMTLTGYIPQLIEEDITSLVTAALKNYTLQKEDITHWCIHPGGKKILEVIEKQLKLEKDDLCRSRKVLAEYGNMSSPTILFVLKDMMEHMPEKPCNVLGIAFGPGLTMETFIAGKP
jgi:predicted naringenin-chalcone synthase